MLDRIQNSLLLMNQCWEMISIQEKVQVKLGTSITIKEVVEKMMKKFKDNNFLENNTKESIPIRFNRTSNTQIPLIDLYRIEIITNTPVLKVKDKAVDNHL